MKARIPEAEFKQLTVDFETFASMLVPNGVLVIHPSERILMHRAGRAFPSGENWWLENFLHKMLISMVGASMLYHDTIPARRWALDFEQIFLEEVEGNTLVRVVFGFQPLGLVWIGQKGESPTHKEFGDPGNWRRV